MSTSVVHGTHVRILVLGSVTGKHIWKICEVNGCMKVTKVYFLTPGDLNIPYNVETVWVSFDQCPNPWQTGGATGYCPKKRVKRQPGRWTTRRFLRYLFGSPGHGNLYHSLSVIIIHYYYYSLSAIITLFDKLSIPSF